MKKNIFIWLLNGKKNMAKTILYEMVDILFG